MTTKITLAICLTIVFFVFLFLFKLYFDMGGGKKKLPSKLPEVGVRKSDNSNAQYVLEVIGLGATLDNFRQQALWNELKSGNSYTTIRDMDPKHYPWERTEKRGASGVNLGASLENGVMDTPTYWVAPVFNAEPICHDENYKDRPDQPQGGLVGRHMDMHLFALSDRELSERPDRILERIFKFFDKNPDVPYVILGSEDSTILRKNYSASEKALNDGYYVPENPDASAILVLARRQRVDVLRPFVFEDMDESNLHISINVINHYGLGRQVYLSYLRLYQKVPLPPGSPYAFEGGGRQPTNVEWLAEAAKLAVRPDIRSAAQITISRLANRFGLLERPQIPSGWKPTPWFPIPWSKAQMKDFDRLPTLGFIHRPVFVKMTDADGKPLQRESERQAALQAGWKETLQTLPESDRPGGPSRVIVATGNNTAQLVNFHGLLRHIGDTGGPEIDPSAPTKFIDMDRRLGNTGAATFFMQMAIGVMGSYREGGVSAAFNLRDRNEASIVLVSPPSEEQRRRQRHPIGGDVFQNATAPAIDPKNYEEPVMK